MAERLKDMFFTRESLNLFAETIRDAYPDFSREHFLSQVLTEDFAAKELKQRMNHTTHCLGQTLPSSFPQAVDILLQAAPHVKGFEALCLPDYIAQFGLESWEPSLQALEQIGRHITCEMAIRPFLDKDPDRVIPYLWKWAEDESPLLRRLASEGSRPRLPWAMALPRFKKDPRPLMPILEKLKDDESEDVRRSVANHLNDISKDNPDIALDVCRSWHGRSDRINKIVKHACRTLLKAGDSRALQIFGYSDPADMEIKNLVLTPPSLHIGDDLRFSFDLVLKEEGMVRLEYAVTFAKAKGKLSRKVFKITENSYPAGIRRIERRHSFADMSTRKHYPGIHHLAINVNGEEKAQASFRLYQTS